VEEASLTVRIFLETLAARRAFCFDAGEGTFPANHGTRITAPVFLNITRWKNAP
jgi:hypothetical protein